MPNSDSNKQTPQGPSFFSFIGEIIQSRLDFYSELRDLYGDMVKVPHIKRAYLVNNPDYIEIILKERHENYVKGGTATIALKAALGHGLLVNHGEEWRKRRRLAAPYFQPKKIVEFTPIIQEYTLDRLKKWKALADTGHEIDISHEVMAIVLKVALQTFYHIQAEDEQLDKMIYMISLVNKFSTSELALFPWFPTINGFKYRQARNYLHKYINSIINTRKLNPGHATDLLDILLSATLADNKTPLSQQEISDEVKTFLMTGHETTGAALSWTMYLLAKHPYAQQKVREEIQAVLNNKLPEYTDLEHLRYTHMVFEEALRLYPPIWMTGRKTLHDDFIDNYTIKSKSEIFVCPYTLHRHPDYWPNPDVFNPERHCPNQRKARPKFAFIPFGGGPRICIASHLAMMQGVMITAMIMKEFHLELSPDHPVELDHFISLKPRYGVKIRLSKVA